MKIMLNGKLLADVNDKVLNQDQVQEMLINYGIMTHNMPLPTVLDITHHAHMFNDMVYNIAHQMMSIM